MCDPVRIGTSRNPTRSGNALYVDQYAWLTNPLSILITRTVRSLCEATFVRREQARDPWLGLLTAVATSEHVPVTD